MSERPFSSDRKYEQSSVGGVIEHRIPPEYEKLLGTVIDSRYQIVKFLGAGGMGAVFQAHQILLNNDKVAIKFIRGTQSESIEQLRQEALAAKQIDHSNVVRIFGFGIFLKKPYLVMEYLDGITLQQQLSDTKKIAIPAALHFALEIAKALAAVHHKDIVHRDLKPSNVMVIKNTSLRTSSSFDAIKIFDFGVAAQIERRLGDSSDEKTGKVSPAGTYWYMAPEQWEKRSASSSIDIYSLGIMIYEMLSGRRPFDAHNIEALRQQHMNDPPPSLRQFIGDWSEKLESIESLILEMLAKDPDERPPANLLVNTLTRLLDQFLPESWRTTPFQSSTCPFLGLGQHSLETSSVLVNRDKDIQDTLSNFGKGPLKRRWLSIEGPRYVGKSSFVWAGVLSRMRIVGSSIERPIIAAFQPIQEPILDLARTLKSALPALHAEIPEIANRLRNKDTGLSELFHEWQENQEHQGARNLIIVLDPLEATMDASPSERLLVDSVLANALTEAHGSIFLITTLRTGQNFQWTKLLPSLAAIRSKGAWCHSLLPVPWDKFFVAAHATVGEKGHVFETKLVGKMRKDAITESIDLPVATHALRELWKRQKFSVSAYQSFHGFKGIISYTADLALNVLDGNQQKRAQLLLLALVRCGHGHDDRPRLLSWDDAVRIAGGGSQGERLLSLLKEPDDRPNADGSAKPPALIKELSMGATLGERWITLAHEILIQRWERLHQWLEADRDMLDRWDALEKGAVVWRKMPASPLPSEGLLAYYQGAGLSAEQCERLETLISPEARLFLTAASNRVNEIRLGTTREHEKELHTLKAAHQEETFKQLRTIEYLEKRIGVEKAKEKEARDELNKVASLLRSTNTEKDRLQQSIAELRSKLEAELAEKIAPLEKQRSEAQQESRRYQTELEQLRKAQKIDQLNTKALAEEAQGNSDAESRILGMALVVLKWIGIAVIICGLLLAGLVGSIELIHKLRARFKAPPKPVVEHPPIVKPPAPPPPKPVNTQQPVLEPKPAPPKPKVFYVGEQRYFGVTWMVLIAEAPVGSPIQPDVGKGSAAFWFDRDEVTVSAYELCVETELDCTINPNKIKDEKKRQRCNWKHKENRQDHPINCVTGNESAKYCKLHGKYLPSDDQWMLAALGTDHRKHPWGNKLSENIKLCWNNLDTTCSVYDSNNDISPFGVRGMAANVAEWTSTSHPNYNGPWAFRGGNYSQSTPTDNRFYLTPGTKNATPLDPVDERQNTLGFRCAKEFVVEDYKARQPERAPGSGSDK